METPEYKVSHWASDGERVTPPDSPEHQSLVIYHTPGHTPDELAIWDPLERVLFVGDTLYEWVPIVFPLEGDLKLYSNTLGRLKTLVQGWNTPVLGDGMGKSQTRTQSHPCLVATLIDIYFLLSLRVQMKHWAVLE